MESLLLLNRQRESGDSGAAEGPESLRQEGTPHGKGQGGEGGRHTHGSPPATGRTCKQEVWMEWEEGCNTGGCQCLWTMARTEWRDLDVGEK